MADHGHVRQHRVPPRARRGQAPSGADQVVASSSPTACGGVHHREFRSAGARSVCTACSTGASGSASRTASYHGVAGTPRAIARNATICASEEAARYTKMSMKIRIGLYNSPIKGECESETLADQAAIRWRARAAAGAQQRPQHAAAASIGNAGIILNSAMNRFTAASRSTRSIRAPLDRRQALAAHARPAKAISARMQSPR